MIDTSKEISLIVDFGCSIGTLTRVLSSIAPTIGLEVDKKMIAIAKKNAADLDFICTDLCHLPFREETVDMAVCSSVLEYIESLENAIMEIKSILKKEGTLFAGYPIETKLLKTVIELIDRNEVKTWDPNKVMSYEQLSKDPQTHKQKFPVIRKILCKHFRLLQKRKTPSKHFPDVISIYECVKLKPLK